MITFMAFVPILTLLILMVALEIPAWKSAPLALVVTVLVVHGYWNMDPVWISASVVRGSLIALEILAIVAGVYILVSVLKKDNAFTLIRKLVSKISKDVRIQAIVLAWFVVAFMEGVAGFGTPSMVVVPILVALGFSPLAAVSMSLIGDGVAVTFGAVGVPMTIGIAKGVGAEQVALLGSDFVFNTYMTTAGLHVIFGTFVPLMILCVLNYIYERSFKKAFHAWKLALLAGFLFTAPFYLSAYLLGPEFPAVVGSLVGLAIFMYAVRKKVFMPKDEWIFEHVHRDSKTKYPLSHYLKAVVPYVLVVVLLLLSRLAILKVSSVFKSLEVGVTDLFGTSIEYVFYPLYSPGFYFLLAAVLGFFMYRLSLKNAKEIVKEVVPQAGKTFIALVSMLAIVQLIMYSGSNALGFPSISLHIATVLGQVGSIWPIFAPIVGLFGAFIAGSSTVSNLMLSSVQVETALAVGLVPVLGLALQSIGSAVGNMVAIHNIISASSVVHFEHAEGKVIKYTIIPAIIYAIGAGILVLIVTL